MGRQEVEKVQPELQDILESISRYIAINGHDVSFVGSFVAFDKGKIERDEKDITKDGAERLFAYGDRETLLIQLHELMGMVLDTKEDFVNW